MDHNHLNENPNKIIEILCKVNLKDDSFHIFYFDRLNGFLCSIYGIMDLAILKECKLLWRDMVGEYGAEPICNDFVKGIAESDWSKIMEG